MNTPSRQLIAMSILLALAGFARGDNPTATDSDAAMTPTPSNEVGGDRPTPAQAELMQGVAERKYQAAIEKADSEHQAEMKKCEGLVWEEEKNCKDQVSTETAQAQAKANKDRKERTPPQ